MKHYFINPETRDLIVLDSEKNSLLVVERIEKVRVMNRGGEVLKTRKPTTCKKCQETGHQARACPNESKS